MQILMEIQKILHNRGPQIAFTNINSKYLTTTFTLQSQNSQQKIEKKTHENALRTVQASRRNETVSNFIAFRARGIAVALKHRSETSNDDRRRREKLE